MRLCEIFTQKYVLVETEYDISVADTGEEIYDYEISEVGSTTLRKLEECEWTEFAAEEIRNSGMDIEEDGIIHVYNGTITGDDAGFEETAECIVYAPEYWKGTIRTERKKINYMK
ncbi:MAG: hypothetical protein HDR11_10250 [Lachnospiraceae bacterium]|nr:hypothetical protein [Lachnospiraceae bacterium]